MQKPGSRSLVYNKEQLNTKIIRIATVELIVRFSI